MPESNASRKHRLGDEELFVHEKADLLDYDSFFELVIANGEMAARVDALHSQHIRTGAKKDVLCLRLVDLWGEKTYPVHRGRPAGRFLSQLLDLEGNAVELDDIGSYRQRLDPREPLLQTAYTWRKGKTKGENRSFGFMSKARRHLMAHRYVDTVNTEGWVRSFTVETIFPYHSRASTFYYKKPYNAKKWAWGDVEHENEIEPTNNAKVHYDPDTCTGTLTFATEFPALKTEVGWVLRPAIRPDRWEIDEEKGSLTFYWNLKPGVEHDMTVLAVVMTDRDAKNTVPAASAEAGRAMALGWGGLEQEQLAWWREELARSIVSIPDPKLQKLYDISRYYLLNSVGGSYWGFIGTDNVIYETCMCDNLITFHALVETNHLEAAKNELVLLHRYLPAARKNASVRMKFVSGIDSGEAALIPFYMSEDGIELWHDNVFGMYTTMSAFHFLALLKTGRYSGDDEFLQSIAYPWFRAYAEYGRLNAAWDDSAEEYTYPIENVGGGGEGYWYRITMSHKLYKRMFTRSDPMFRHCDFAPIGYFPKDEIADLDSNWIDVVLNFRWILEQAARMADDLGVDGELREKWRHVASHLRIPQNDLFFLSNSGESARPSIGGAAVGGLFWPAEGTFEELDRDKVDRTFRKIAGQRQIVGFLDRKGRAWDAVYGLAYAYMGRGEECLQLLHSFDWAADHRGIEMRESIGNHNYYYLLNHGSLVLLTRTMLLQTYGKKIRVFPAVPEDWRAAGVSFRRLPAEGGFLVAGSTGPGGSEVVMGDRKETEIIRFTGKFPSLEILPVRLDPEASIYQFELRCPHALGEIQVAVSGIRGEGGYVVTISGVGKEIKAKKSKTGYCLEFSVSAPADVQIHPIAGDPL